MTPRQALEEAARYVNAQSEEIGLHATLDWLQMGPVEDVAHVAEQRGLRMILIMEGKSANFTKSTPIALDVEQRAALVTFTSAYMDGLAIGWKAHELHGDTGRAVAYHAINELRGKFTTDNMSEAYGDAYVEGACAALNQLMVMLGFEA